MWWNIGPHLKRRMAYERGETAKSRESQNYFAGRTGKDDFFEILIRKYGTLTRAWRIALDTDDSGLLDAREFIAAMDVIGYVGNVRTLWFNLDEDQSGYISLAEMDPEAAFALEKFRARCCKTFGSMDAAWEQCLDKDHSGALTLPELEIAAPELGYHDMNEVHYLFSLLRLEPAAFRVPKHEVLFLQVWEERKQQTVSRAWRTGARWVNKDPHFYQEPANIPESWKSRKSMLPDAIPSPTRSATASPGRATSPGPRASSKPHAPGGRCPPDAGDSATDFKLKRSTLTPAGAAAYAARRPQPKSTTPQPVRDCDTPASLVPTNWADVDGNEAKSQVSDWTDVVATDKSKAWTDFESYLVRTFGSLVHAFDMMDTSGDGSIEREEWMHMVTRKLLYCRASEALRLFDSKVDGGTPGVKMIKYQDMGITNEEWIIYNHGRRQKQQQTDNRNVQMKPQAFGGQGMRWKMAAQVHEIRMKCKPKKQPEAFWTTLPSGWGFPPSYIDPRHSAAAEKNRRWFPPMSARGAPEPAFTAWTEKPAEPLSAR